jgi:hypothetical protein
MLRTLAKSSQCCRIIANRRISIVASCRWGVPLVGVARQPWDFQSLNSSSICQRARYSTTISFQEIRSGSTFVT